MFRKNKDFGVALQPVVMALTLSRQKHRERIIIGPEWEVQKYMEGKMVKTKLLDMERPLGQLIFDWTRESAKDWNEAVIYELKSALQNPFQRRKRERKAKDFLAQKVASDNAVSTFWAKNCRNVYEYCKKKIPFKQSADLFESRMMTLTRLSKINVLNQGEKYAVHDVREKVVQIMRTCSYRQDANLQIWYPQRSCNTEFVIIKDSVLAGIMYYLNRLQDWHTCFQVCEICGKHFVADSAHHSLCSDACRKEQNRLNKQAFDMRAQRNTYDRDYSGSTRRMRDLIKRKSKTVSAEEYAAAEGFYEQFRDEAKKRKKMIKTQQEKIAFRNWLFQKEQQIEDILGGTK